MPTVKYEGTSLLQARALRVQLESIKIDEDDLVSGLATQIALYWIFDIVFAPKALRTLTICRNVGSTTVREISLATLSRLERHAPAVGMFTLTFFVLVMLTISIMALMKRTIHKGPRQGGCMALACDRALKDLQILLDDKVDPCQDLYNHVCRKWRQTAHEGLNFLDNSARLTMSRVNSRLLFDTSPETEATRDMQSVAKFLKMCWRYVNSAAPSGGRQALEISEIREYADIGEVSNFSNFIEHLIHLSLARGVVTVIGMKLLRSVNGVNRLHLFPGQSIAQKMDETTLTDEMLEYIRGVFAQYNLSRTFDASSISAQERRMQNMLSSSVRKQSYKLVVLRSLSNNFSTERWISTLNSILAEDDKVGSLSTIKVHGLDTVRKIIRFIEGLVDHGTAYIRIQVLMEAFRFDFIRRSTQHKSKRANSCLKATLDVVTQAPFVIETQVLGWPSEREGDVSFNILSEVVSTATAEENIVGMTSNNKRRVTSLLWNALIYAQAESFTNVTSMSVEVFNASLATVGFPAIYMRLKTKQRGALLKAPLHETDDIYASRFMDSRVFYDSIMNVVFLPVALRDKPVTYSAEVPVEYSIAMLGALIARELIRTVFPGCEVSEGERCSDELKRAQFYQDCVAALARAVFNVSLEEIDGHISDIAQWVLAAQWAHGALRTAIEKFERLHNWNEYWVQAQRVFFRRFCLMSCTAKDERYLQAARIRCILPLINIAEFTDVFGCHMNSSHVSRSCKF
ncbi:hypothetical protein HPB49_008482 [Dermacentor silvarum]|uniref:Uncharacterized protein n=1 Tax=Dermacentor silvarum TaxID=543639 RepID=A0ACB8DBM9_DERSI|nr:hypothetical protein HPB49_008482 [Dermacentor silvarum]